MARGTVVITGTSSGIGRVTAERLVAEGFRVLAGVRRAEDAPPGTEALVLDVSDPGAAATAKARVDELGGTLHGLVNNAGITVQGPVEFLDLDEFRHQMEVNVVGPIALTQALLPALRAGRGRVVNVSSIGGKMAVPFLSPYSASKFALEAVSDSLRMELKPFGVHVAVIEPGSADTPIWRKGQDRTEETVEALGAEGRALYGKRVEAFAKFAGKTADRAFPPSKVADAIAHALTAEKPRTRYLVGADARMQAAIKKVLPDRAVDAVIARLTGV